MSPDESDYSAVASQLGRAPRGSWSVARRCACGLPQVIETAPRLADGTPFPTLWWLTCRSLNSAIGRLEAAGWMEKINVRLASDGGMREQLEASIAGYLEARDAIERLEAAGHPGGGPRRVKCLHAHTAHHLVSGDNPVGREVLEELRWVEPVEPCV